MPDIQPVPGYPSAQILAVMNNPNDYPPKKVAEMINAGCFDIDQLKGIKDAQRDKVMRAMLAGKEDIYYSKCMGPGATVEDCDFFIANFPTSSKIKEIETRKANLALEKERQEAQEREAREKQEALQREEQKDLNELSAKVNDLNLDFQSKTNHISAFISKYPFTRFAKEIDDLKSKAHAIEQNRYALEKERERKQEDENAWQTLLNQLASNWPIAEKRRAIEAYESRYSNHLSEVPAKKQELANQEDEDAWQKVLMLLAQDVAPEQKVAALNNYKLQYSNHTLEVDAKIQDAERERNIMPEIRGVLANSASTVNDFMKLIKKYPSKKTYIRDCMLKDMIVNPSRYTREAMYCLMNGKYSGEITYDQLFSMGDLQDAGVATYDILNHINTHPSDQDDRNKLEDSLLPETNFKSAKNNTDVYFFGVPGSGKSTVLAGLFKLGSTGNLRLQLPAHGDHIGYNYASILQSYLENNVFPQATKTRFIIRQDLSPTPTDVPNPFAVPSDGADNGGNPFANWPNSSDQSDESLIGTEVSDKFIQIIDAIIQENPGKENQEDHKISIIEMPGERTLDFAASDVRNPEEMDRLLGTGTRELFMNDNRKLFFFVIDPKAQKSYNVNLNGINCPMTQAQALEALLEFIGKVPGLLEKIDAMHIILSKSDLLRNPNSFDVIQQDVINCGYESVIHEIKGLCNPARSNINVQCGHAPHLFTFSLGKVYPGHMIKYDKADAAKILQVIIANTYSTRRNPTKLTSIINWMNK